LGIFLAGLWGVVSLLSGRMKLKGYFAYGPFLAIAGIVMIIWGNQIYSWLENL
jgi:prepilin signal peptidase PulO-like enzyme (type II secretory pathway)